MGEKGITYFDEEKQEWFNYGPWIHQDSSTIGTFAIESDNEEEFCDITGSDYRLPDSLDLISCAFGNVVSTSNPSCLIKKLFWRKQPRRQKTKWLSRLKNVVIGVSEDTLGYSTDATATMVSWYDTREALALESEIKIRGIFDPKFKRKILFSKTLEFKTAKLPRWKPKTIIGGRTVEE